MVAAPAVRLTSMLRGNMYLMRDAPRIEAERTRQDWQGNATRAIVGPRFRHVHTCLDTGEDNRCFYRAFGSQDHYIKQVFCSVDTERFASLRREGRGQWKAAPIAHSANLLLIREDPLRTLVQQRVMQHERCRWRGFVNHDEMGGWYAPAEILMFLRSFEPWELLVNESITARTVLVCNLEARCAPGLTHSDIGAVYLADQIDTLIPTLNQLLSNFIRLAREQRTAGPRSNEYSIVATAAEIKEALSTLRKQP